MLKYFLHRFHVKYYDQILLFEFWSGASKRFKMGGFPPGKRPPPPPPPGDVSLIPVVQSVKEWIAAIVVDKLNFAELFFLKLTQHQEFSLGLYRISCHELLSHSDKSVNLFLGRKLHNITLYSKFPLKTPYT